MTNSQFIDQLSVHWPTLSSLTSSQFIDRLSVYWPALSLLTSSQFNDQLSVHWLALSSLTNFEFTDQLSVYWPALSSFYSLKCYKTFDLVCSYIHLAMKRLLVLIFISTILKMAILVSYVLTIDNSKRRTPPGTQLYISMSVSNAKTKCF